MRLSRAHKVQIRDAERANSVQDGAETRSDWGSGRGRGQIALPRCICEGLVWMLAAFVALAWRLGSGRLARALMLCLQIFVCETPARTPSP